MDEESKYYLRMSKLADKLILGTGAVFIGVMVLLIAGCDRPSEAQAKPVVQNVQPEAAPAEGNLTYEDQGKIGNCRVYYVTNTKTHVTFYLTTDEYQHSACSIGGFTK